MSKNNSIVFLLKKKNTSPSITGRFYPASSTIPHIDEVYDPKTESNRIVRYIPGERTIWMDEQDTPPDAKVRVSIEFLNGMKIVNPREKTLLEYLRIVNWNDDIESDVRMPNKPILFYENKPGSKAKEIMADDKQTIKAINAAYELDLESLISYARVLKVDVKRDPADIRYAMRIIAEENPTAFLEGLNNPTTSRSNKVLQAIERGIIIADHAKRSMRWANNGATIMSAPVGQDLVDCFVDFTFQSDGQGEEVYEMILKLLQPSQEKETKFETDESKTKVDSLSTEDLLAKLVEAEIVTIAGISTYMYLGKQIAKGKGKTIEKIDSAPELKKALMIDLQQEG